MNAESATEKLVKELSMVRKRKIQQIKSRISAGKYRVNNVQLVKALFLAN